MSRKEKQKIKISKYFAVFKNVRLPWVWIIFGLAASIAMMTAELNVATMTSDVIDTSQKAIDTKVLIKYIYAVAVMAVFTIFSSYFIRKMEETITLRVRVKLWKKIMHLPTKYYDEDNGNELVSRITSDASAPASLFTVIVSFVVCVVTTINAFSILFDTNATLARYSLLIIPLTLVFCVLYGIFQFKLGIYGTVTMAGSLGYLAERVRNFRLIKSAVEEKRESVRGNATFKKMYKAEFLSWLLVAGYQLSSSLFSIMFIVIVFVIGGQLIPTGKITIGDLTGFYMITSVVSIQLMQLFMDAGSLFGTFGTMKKIADISTSESEMEGGKEVPEICNSIEFKNVSFSYNDEREVLKNVSLTIPAGKVTAIIGGNGAGKSTLFKLIERLYEPTGGEILFGNESIGQYNLSDWRRKFSYVFQNSPLIGGTVRENITYGIDREVTDEELVEVAKKANCYDFVMEKPDGFDENVGLDGDNFSGGQGQCISIARAMLRNTNYLLLDEATSNLDVVSEALVTEALDNLMKDKTTIMISHNYASTRNADYIIVMKDGTVEAAGSPQELMDSNEYYRMFCKTM